MTRYPGPQVRDEDESLTAEIAAAETPRTSAATLGLVFAVLMIAAAAVAYVLAA